MDLPRRLDELDLPTQTGRRSGRGWEVRTRHFVVFATARQQDAEWTARQLEATWAEIGVLADQWTDVHRQPSFAVGAVGVTLGDGRWSRGPDPVPELSKTAGAATFFLNLAKGQEALAERLPDLRGDTLVAFLRVTGHYRALPDWLQEGLTAYVAEGPSPDPFDDPTGSTHATGSPQGGTPAQAGSWTRPNLPAEPGPQASRWVRFLLEGDDARHAPRLFHAISVAVADWQPGSPGGGWSSVGGAPGSGSGRSDRWQDLLPWNASGDVREKADQWLADPRAGQPVLKPLANDEPPLEHHRDMVLILKLIERFGPQAGSSARPKVQEFRAGAQVTVTPTTTRGAATTSLATLHRRLVDLPRWATVDVDGTLLVSTDRERLDDLFAVSRSDVRYRTYQDAGRTVLEATFSETGEVAEAWLEENADDPTRPIARVHRRQR
jgi:hypothetical protein